MSESSYSVPIGPAAIKAARHWIASDPTYSSSLGTIEQFRLVLDANVILADIYWLEHNRKDPDAQTRLQQLIASATVLPTAPVELRAEIASRLDEFAERYNEPVARYEEHWRWYENRIDFQEVTPQEGLEPEARDPDDLPYLYVCLGSEDIPAVYTKDADLSAMGAPVVGEDVIIAMLEYARATGAQYTLMIGTGMVGTVLTQAGIASAKKLIEAFRNLPPFIQGVIGIAVAWSALNPDIRERVVAKLKEYETPAKKGFHFLGRFLVRWASLVSHEMKRSEEAQKQLRRADLLKGDDEAMKVNQTNKSPSTR